MAARQTDDRQAAFNAVPARIGPTPNLNTNPKGLFGARKMTKADRLSGIGALLRDAGDMGLGRSNNHFGAFQQQQQMFAQQEAQKATQQQTLSHAMQMAGNNPNMQRMAAANPQAFIQGMIKRGTGHNTVAGGASVATYGPNGQPQLTQASQNFQHGNRIGTVGQGGMQTYDLGPSAADQNTAFSNDTTRQNNVVTQGINQGKLTKQSVIIP